MYDPPVLIGQTLSHFRILRLLGEGGMGAVYLAEDLRLKRQVALKILPDEFGAVEERLQRFRLEAESLAALDHPNIVTVYSIEESSGTHFFTMQHVEGVPLSQKIQGDGVPIDEFFDLAVQLADALAAAHDRGVLHRDVKPSNVMVSPDGRPRLLDFGLAKHTEREGLPVDTGAGTELQTRAGTVLGTVSYMSPEQARGKELDARSDIFSLGIVLHEMATGRRPFDGDDQVEILSSIIKDAPPSVNDVVPALPKRLSHIILRALEKDPALRFQSARDLRDELSALRDELRSEPGSNPGSRPTSLAERADVDSRLPWRRAATIGAGVMLLLAAFVLIRGLRDESTTPAAIADRSIAVLPFENLSPDADNEYFSVGMTEELIGKLSRIESFRVRSTPLGWGSEAEGTAEAIARELGVNYLVRGSVRKAGNAIRINARLIDTGADILWSGEFDGSLEDIFGAQEDTAKAIARALDVELSIAETEALRARYTENAAAYDAYLRGWAAIESFHVNRDGAAERLAAARSRFEHALDLDPEYPLALAGLAAVASYTYYLRVDRSREQVQRAEDLARQALAIDPGLPEALIVLGQVSYFRGDHATSGDYLRSALKRDPDNGYAWCELAHACVTQSPPDAESAEAAARKAIRFQPQYTFAHLQLGRALQLQNRFEEAIPAFRRAVDLDPGIRSALLGLGDSHMALENYEEALNAYERAQLLRDSEVLRADIEAARAALEGEEPAGP